MTNDPEIYLKQRRRLLDLGVRVDPDEARRVSRRFDNGGTKWSIHHPKSRTRIGSLHARTVDKLHRLWLAGELRFLNERDALDLVVATNEADRQEDIKEGPDDPFEASHQEAGIQRNVPDHFSHTRFLIMREAERLAPPHLWVFLTLTDEKIPKDEALSLIREYDRISFDKERALIEGDTESRLLNFRQFKRFLFMHYEMNYRFEYPEADRNVINVACDLKVLGGLESDEHLVIAGKNLMRYAFWLSLENEQAFFDSLRDIKKRPASYRRFVEVIKETLAARGVWSQQEVVDRAMRLRREEERRQGSNGRA